MRRNTAGRDALHREMNVAPERWDRNSRKSKCREKFEPTVYYAAKLSAPVFTGIRFIALGHALLLPRRARNTQRTRARARAHRAENFFN